MSLVDRYQAYADAFERSYESDDWSHIEPFFTEDAVYDAGPDAAQGRAAILERMRESVNGFDRKMDARELVFDPPRAEGESVHSRWTAVYRKAGCPDLHLSGTEEAVFEGDRIRALRGAFDPEAMKAMGEWMEANGAKLG